MSILFWVPALLSGLLVVLSSAPYDMWYLAYIAYVPLFFYYREQSPATQGTAYALCCSLIAANWWHSTIIFSFWFFVLIVGILCLSFFLWGYLCAANRYIHRYPLAALLLPAVIWVGIERILSSELVGIPCNVGISQWGQPVLIQSASLFGIYATSFLIVMANSLAVLLIDVVRTGKWRDGQNILAVASGILLLAGNTAMGLEVVSSRTEPKLPVKVTVIQPVISTDMYLNSWRSPETRSEVKRILGRLTEEAVKAGADIVAWPEGGNGFYNFRIDSLRDQLYRTARQYETDLLISSNDLDESGRKFNSVFSVSQRGELLGRYDKVLLIPGPEDSYTAGTGFNTISSSFGKVGSSICYESNFPSPLRKSTANGAELLFVSTSDAAFKKTALTVNHTRTASFRAVENNRWVVHASNTGPSVIVAPTGEVVARSGMYARGVVAGQVEMLSEKTVFTRYGYWLPVVCAFVTVVLSLGVLPGIKHVAAGLSEKMGSLAAADEEAIASGLKRRARNLVFGHLPRWILLAALLVSIVAAGIAVMSVRVGGGGDLAGAFTDFLAPLDTFVKDNVSNRFMQARQNTCGPAVVAYVATFFGKELRENDVVEKVKMTEKGTSMLELRNALTGYGFEATGIKASYGALLQEPLPVIAYINDDHYVVVNEVTKTSVFVFDPAIGHVKLGRAVFEQAWKGYLLRVRMKPIKPGLSADG
jgi:apolipoprotein N-acyltransferase